ncbi:hypothetical protein NDU88_004869 [Pleurodeles waltl]|uniref:Uncharacterized protein n=1 Tax=Pleurodeles waltl TaxID=8319 RepID=A0AAV7M8X8_PLEWA|nr:hypothetical protein NDU88_004869 [Pleurodeles waltl]
MWVNSVSNLTQAQPQCLAAYFASPPASWPRDVLSLAAAMLHTSLLIQPPGVLSSSSVRSVPPVHYGSGSAAQFGCHLLPTAVPCRTPLSQVLLLLPLPVYSLLSHLCMAVVKIVWQPGVDSKLQF